MALFCLSTSVALLGDYILTYTLLAPVLLFCERNNRHSLSDNDQVEEKQQSEVSEDGRMRQTSCMAVYSRFLVSLQGRVMAGVVLTVLLLVASFGVARMRTNFEPAKAFPSDSPLTQSLQGIRCFAFSLTPSGPFLRSSSPSRCS